MPNEPDNFTYVQHGKKKKKRKGIQPVDLSFFDLFAQTRSLLAQSTWQNQLIGNIF